MVLRDSFGLLSPCPRSCLLKAHAAVVPVLQWQWRMRIESVRYCFAHSWLGVTKATGHVLLQAGRQNLLVTINSRFQFRTCRFLNLYCRFVWSARIPGKNNRRRSIPLTKSQ